MRLVAVDVRLVLPDPQLDGFGSEACVGLHRVFHLVGHRRDGAGVR